MIVILAAMDEEVDALKGSIKIKEEKMIHNTECIFGELKGKEVLLAKSGVGKVEAAIRMTMIASLFDVEYLINIGSAGSLDENIPVGSVIIPTILGVHDFDVPDEEWSKDFTDERHTFYPTERLLKIAKTISDDKTFFAPHVSGDSFIYRDDQIEKIKREFPRAKSCEMEAAAIANACEVMDIPYIIIRSISDVTVKKDSEIDYDNFLKKAAKNSALFCERFIAKESQDAL